VTQLTDVRLGRPAADVMTPPSPPGVRRSVVTAPDLAAAVDRAAPWRLPDSLAGLAATRSLLEGTATYGSGLVRFAVLPLPWTTAGDVLATARSAGAAELHLDGGTGSQVGSAMLNVVVARGDDGEHAYLVAGLVTADVLTEAARQLLADPPGRRDP
jgi:hypothetical protein